MADRKYQTIDPLIMETLNLNQKRIHHIFDILHGRDSRPETDRVLRSASIGNNGTAGKLPRLYEERAKSPKYQHLVKAKQIKKQRNYSASFIQHPQRSPKTLHNIQQQPITHPKQPKQVQPRTKPKPNPNPLPQSQPQQEFLYKSIPQRRSQLIHDYGMQKNRHSKSQEINPKDVYRIEIETMVGKVVEIEELEDAEKLMKRLKRRYQHLRRFDKEYYSKLNQSQFMLL